MAPSPYQTPVVVCLHCRVRNPPLPPQAVVVETPSAWYGPCPSPSPSSGGGCVLSPSIWLLTIGPWCVLGLCAGSPDVTHSLCHALGFIAPTPVHHTAVVGCACGDFSTSTIVLLGDAMSVLFCSTPLPPTALVAGRAYLRVETLSLRRTHPSHMPSVVPTLSSARGVQPCHVGCGTGPSWMNAHLRGLVVVCQGGEETHCTSQEWDVTQT